MGKTCSSETISQSNAVVYGESFSEIRNAKASLEEEGDRPSPRPCASEGDGSPPPKSVVQRRTEETRFRPPNITKGAEAGESTRLDRESKVGGHPHSGMPRLTDKRPSTAMRLQSQDVSGRLSMKQTGFQSALPP
jgi:hypothetical protein